jgi:hypothetical protein
MRTVPRGRAYIGVGPEQNFTYIAAVQPSMAFIVDIRRGNMLLQLMYKAIFELSSDRVDFVSRLFSRKLPEGLGSSATVKEASQSQLCAYLSVALLAGLLANALAGWWWADPAAALAIAAVAVREGRASWRGEGCCDGC